MKGYWVFRYISLNTHHPLPIIHLHIATISISDFLQLRHELPVVDVRSEGEFQGGHVPLALNIPILTNSDRIEVGTIYKQKGQQEAIRAGFRLVGPRLASIIEETEKAGSELIVHCWRGGMRSANFCQFAEMAKVKTHQLAGGYKAYRTEVLASFTKPFDLIVIAGCTGSGKTDLLRALKNKGEQVIDLELLASHKGSVFGGLMMPTQPATEQFENHLFEVIMSLDRQRRIWIEDESISIGTVYLPQALWQQMMISPMVNIEVDKSMRIQRLVAEYGHAGKHQFLEAMTKITKRLGGQHFNAAKEKLMQGDMAAVIEILLTYYDKAYLGGLAKNQSRLYSSLSWDGRNTNDITDSLINKSVPL